MIIEQKKEQYQNAILQSIIKLRAITGERQSINFLLLPTVGEEVIEATGHEPQDVKILLVKTEIFMPV